MSQQSQIPIPKYTDITTRTNKTRPKIDDIINEQHAEQLRKEMLAEQSEHNLDEIPAEVLLESFLLSQLEESKEKLPTPEEEQNSGSTDNNINNDKNNTSEMTQEDKDRLLAMQFEFAGDEEDNINTNQSVSTSNKNKRAWNGNTNKKRSEDKVRIQPNYHFDDSDLIDDFEDNDEIAGITLNDSNTKVRKDCSGNKMAISGTIRKHDFDEWSAKHVSRLNEYNVNLGSDSALKDARLGNKAYNSFRRDLEKKGFKKFDQPTPVDKK